MKIHANRLYLAIYATTFIAMSYLLMTFVVHSWDVFWHVRMGLDFLETGQGLFTNKISYTMQDAPFENPYAGFQVLMAMIYDHFGWQGLRFLRVVAAGLSLFILAKYAQRWVKVRSFPFVIIASFAVTSLLWRLMLRPEIWIGPLMLSSLLSVSLLEQGYKKRGYLLAFIVGVLWLYFSTAFQFYYMIFGAHWAATAFDLLKRRPWVKQTSAWVELVLFGLGLFCVGFLGVAAHPLLGFLQFSQNWGDYVGEMAPLTADTASDLTRVHLATSAFFLVYFLWRRNVFWILIFAALVWKSFGVIKVNNFLGFYLATAACVFLYDNRKHLNKMAFKAAAFAVLAFQIYGLYEPVAFYYYPTHVFSFRHPIEVAEMAQREGWMEDGRVLAPFGYGSMTALMFPKAQPNLDGRGNILYPIDVVAKYNNLFYNEVDATKQIKKDDPKYIWDSRKLPYPGLFYHPDYEVRAIGIRSFLFEKGRDRSGEVTLLLADPECFAYLDHELLKKQIQDLLPQVSVYAGEHAMLILALEMIQSKQPIKEALVRRASQFKLNDWTRRFGARLANDIGEYELTVLMVNNLAEIKGKDALVAAEALIKKGNMREAFRQLQLIEDLYLQYPELQHLLTLLNQIKDRHPKAIKESYLSGLAKRVDASKIAAGDFYPKGAWAYRACLDKKNGPK